MITNRGFTFIEIIIYIALLSIFIPGIGKVAWDSVNIRTKNYVMEEVHQNLRYSSQRIIKEIRDADSISSITPSSLALSMSDSSRNPTIINLSAGKIKISYGGSGDCPTSNPCDLTSSDVVVSSLIFTNLSSGNSKNIKFSTNIKFNSSSSKSLWQYDQNFTGSAELRKI